MAAGDPGLLFDAGNPYERPSFTLGIEEEYMVLDPQTYNLRSHVNLELISKGRVLLHEHIKPEMHGSMLEIGTAVCKDVKEAAFEVTKIRSIVNHLAKQNGLLIGAASTHPFAHWEDQDIYPDDRYQIILEDMQLLARSLLIFGMHIHIGIESREVQIQLMNEMRYFMPHVLAISTNSPFWEGADTGLKSFRSKIFERFPRTALPDIFADWGEYQHYVNLLVKTGSIDNAKKIWWDIRPHPFFPTLEIRICDLPMRIEETIAIAALCQAIAAKLYSLYSRNLSFRQYRRSLLMENKWRAVRYGLDGKLIDWGRQRNSPPATSLENCWSLSTTSWMTSDLGRKWSTSTPSSRMAVVPTDNSASSKKPKASKPSPNTSRKKPCMVCWTTLHPSSKAFTHRRLMRLHKRQALSEARTTPPSSTPLHFTP